MLFDAMTGEDIPYETLSQENKDLYDAAGVAIEAMKTCGDKDTNVLTNGDRIRAMGDEELAKALLEASDAGIYIGFCQEKEECIYELDEGGVPEERCLECMMQWLRKPAEDAHE